MKHCLLLCLALLITLTTFSSSLFAAPFDFKDGSADCPKLLKATQAKINLSRFKIKRANWVDPDLREAWQKERKAPKKTMRKQLMDFNNYASRSLAMQVNLAFEVTHNFTHLINFKELKLNRDSDVHPERYSYMHHRVMKILTALGEGEDDIPATRNELAWVENAFRLRAVRDFKIRD